MAGHHSAQTSHRLLRGDQSGAAVTLTTDDIPSRDSVETTHGPGSLQSISKSEMSNEDYNICIIQYKLDLQSIRTSPAFTIYECS